MRLVTVAFSDAVLQTNVLGSKYL